MEKMVLDIDVNNHLIEYTLPAINNRKGMLNLSQETGIKRFLISYEVWDGIWHLQTNDYTRLSQNHYTKEDTILEEGTIISGKIYEGEIRFTLIARAFNKDKAVFEKYDIRRENKICIGSSNHCEVVLNEKFVSSTHVILNRQENGWYITDQSRNGTYLNNKRVSGVQRLHTFDRIYIMGFDMVYLGSVLAVNRIGQVFVRLRKAESEQLSNHQIYEDHSSFSRSPRLIEPLDDTEIEIEMPPNPARKSKTPLVFLLGPSLTMPIPILSMVLFNVAVNSGSGVNPLSYMGMAISVMMFAALGIMWTMLRHRYDKRATEENEEQRSKAYNAYISQNAGLIEEKQRMNRNILERKYFASNVLAQELLHNIYPLWNRNVNHEDFLQIRMGSGSIDSPNPIRVPKERFSVEQDPLASLPYAVYEKYKILSPVAKTLDLKANKIVGVVGKTPELQNLANSMIVQIAALHSYTDVKMAFLLRGADEELDLDWVRWLPHVFSEDKKIRYIANEENTYQNVLYALTNELRTRKEEKQDNMHRNIVHTHYVVFSTEKSLFENETIYKYMVDEEDYGFTFVLLHGNMDALPNQCKTIVENSEKFRGIYNLEETITSKNVIQFDMVSREQAEIFARFVCGFHITELAEGMIPDTVDYFDLMHIGRIEQWDLIKHYKENRSFEGIKALIGIGTGNKPLYLDIHEKKHGPHGLVAGTTGSGKSETIQTFIISLALNYHPDEVAFVLIDYKGGGMANAFLGLPHLAGTITNLGSEDTESIDGNQTRRALISIRSEIKRRQTIFNQYKVNHIDLYMRLYRDGKAKEPMPHLIMISDEFAELKKEQPEFIKELVSTARVGRSLGIHLILATQKPGGVVDDEIWSNSRFKLCLRVQDKQDSMGMLKRPEAASLTRTGRAYLQIGNDEVFELFQSGYSGASYEPKDETEEGQEKEVTMIGLDGSEILVKVKENTSLEKADTQLATCVKYIIRMAQELSIPKTAPLWLPQLPEHIVLEELEDRYEVTYQKGRKAIAGLIDHPEKQRQYPLVIDFDMISNLIIVGSAGCGKTTFLQTMVYSMMKQYSSDEVQFYCLDFSSRTFRVFEHMPHFGGVVFSDENEKVIRLFQLLRTKMQQRKVRMGETGVGSYIEYKKIYDDMPMILVLVDNYFEFGQLYGNLDEEFIQIAREGSKYGIQVAVTLNHMNDMRYKTKQNFSMVIPLRLNEKGDYMETLGASPEILPTPRAGRGLIAGEDILEFQTALPVASDTEAERRKIMQEKFCAYESHHTGIRADQIPVLPREEPYEVFYERYAEREGDDRLPIGYYADDISVASIDLASGYCISVSSTTATGIVNYVNHILHACRKAGYESHLVRMNQSMRGFVQGNLDGLYQNYDDVYALLIRLKEEFRDRSSQWKAYAKEHPDSDIYQFCKERFGKIFVVIDDMSEFEELIYHPVGQKAMNEIMELFFKEGRGRGIYFVAGFPTDMNSSALYLQAAKNYNSYKTGIHLGGLLNQQKIYEFALPMTKQMKPLADNIGYENQNGKPRQIFIPIETGENNR